MPYLDSQRPRLAVSAVKLGECEDMSVLEDAGKSIYHQRSLKTSSYSIVTEARLFRKVADFLRKPRSRSSHHSSKPLLAAVQTVTCLYNEKNELRGIFVRANLLLQMRSCTC